jgi:glutamate-ammonia-ligase adenylyltransferase
LWSLICKNILSKIFHNYLFAKYKDYKKYFFVIGMGKIGVKDLNFTSDIDLIIFFDSKNSPYELYEFNKSIKTLIGDISNISPTFFHKIDLRLRPDLGNSFIVTDMEDAIDYYSSYRTQLGETRFHRSCFLCGDIVFILILYHRLVVFFFEDHLTIMQ